MGTAGMPTSLRELALSTLRLVKHYETLITVVAALLTAIATGFIAWFTHSLRNSTQRLWLATQTATETQTRDTRILQRAYVGTEPRGLHEMTDQSVIAHVAVLNSGNLPARNIRNQIKIGWFDDGNKSDFEDVEITEPSSVLLLPKTEFERGTAALSKQDTDRYRLKEGFVYVWGRIEYEDGFGRPRWLIFCHRYNCSKPEILRLHHHHNNGN
jgi:hypothetical protein